MMFSLYTCLAWAFVSTIFSLIVFNMFNIFKQHDTLPRVIGKGLNLFRRSGLIPKNSPFLNKPIYANKNSV